MALNYKIQSCSYRKPISLFEDKETINKFKGNSTTLTITDSGYSGTIYNTGAVYNTIWNENDGDGILYQGNLNCGHSNGSIKEIYRMGLGFNTGGVHRFSLLLQAWVILYCFQKNWNVDNIIFQTGDNVYPSTPTILATDYDKDLYSGNYGSFALLGLNLNADNNFVFNNLTKIKLQDFTQFMFRLDNEINGIDPGANNMIEKFHGPLWATSSQRPRLYLVYNKYKFPQKNYSFVPKMISGDF